LLKLFKHFQLVKHLRVVHLKVLQDGVEFGLLVVPIEVVENRFHSCSRTFTGNSVGHCTALLIGRDGRIKTGTVVILHAVDLLLSRKVIVDLHAALRRLRRRRRLLVQPRVVRQKPFLGVAVGRASSADEDQVVDDQSDPGFGRVSLGTPEAIFAHRMVETVASVGQSVEEAVLAEVISHAAKTLISGDKNVKNVTFLNGIFYILLETLI